MNNDASSINGEAGSNLIILKRLALLFTALALCTEVAVTQTPPAITAQPASQIVAVGNRVNLSVTATGAGPLTYQWQFNGTNLPNGVITTVAGGGVGDGGAATNAGLIAPSGVAVDGAGNLFIADAGNNRVRRVGTNGIVITIAGTGISGYSGDGGTATSARLDSPSDVALDPAGTLFIADAGNSRVRRVGTDGIITTIAGDGQSGYSGDGGVATNANLGGSVLWGYGLGALAVDRLRNVFIADPYHSVIRKVDTNGIITTVAGNRTEGYWGDGGAATNASLGQAVGVAVDSSGNLFIADTLNNVVRKVDTYGIITTVAGNGMRGSSGDGGLAMNGSIGFCGAVLVDAGGNLFITDENSRIRRVDTNGIITTIAGNGVAGYAGDNGMATNASLNNPGVLAEDAAGNLYIADSGNDRVRKVTSSGIISTVAGNGSDTFSGDGLTATNASLDNPTALAANAAGDLIIVDAANNRIRRIDGDGIITTIAGNGVYGGSGDGGAATNASLGLGQGGLGGATADLFGQLFIADTGNNRVRKVSTNGIITTVAGNGISAYAGDGGAATNASLFYPGGVAVDALGDLFIADTYNNRIRRVASNGVITTVAGSRTAGYSGDGGPATNASLNNPNGVMVGAAGHLFIADTGNNRIRKVDTNGIITTFAGTGTAGYFGDRGAATNAGFYAPTEVAADGAGNLFVTDRGNKCVREIATNGIIITVAGNGIFGFSGDDGPATDASVAGPGGVAVDASGNLFIADTSNNRIRRVAFVGLPSLPLRNVTPANAGGYRAIISNSYGSVTSAVAAITVVLPPLGITKVSGPAVLLLMTNASPLLKYVLQTATNLAPPIQWHAVITNHADSLSNWGLLDNIDASDPTRFYRVQLRSP
jgi:sugar lactone lactonase YvrE